ncbi:protein THYLAKOID ASSEMBLY 8, chloroplastic-like [Bidens hawaiensis]|uniref:protein THYLAKOID ASSEMBLY 8, chloroplastic-like n=1 Tax=Bidens hawaiensis TaxID=980011 RepID=UPI00404B428C
MASSLRLYLPLHLPHHNPTAVNSTIRCGPRSNRGPLHKGRTLSIEAIQAVQSLKRSHRSDPTTVSKTLSRLVKSDLIAAFNELLRQHHFDLSLTVFNSIKSEHWYKPDLTLYAKLTTEMASKGMADEIDRLIDDVEVADMVSADGKGVVTLIKALLAADRADATVRVYEMMKSGGWRFDSVKDEYVGKVLSRGLRRLGKKEVADEIDFEIGRVSGGVLDKTAG